MAMTDTLLLPPLHQSDVEIAACPRAYVEIRINGKEQPDSIPSERGSDIHRVMSAYIDHCAKNKVQSDWRALNRLSAASGPVAGSILDGLRDRYVVDWQHVYGTEITLALDEDFAPTDMTVNRGHRFLLELGVNYSGRPGAYEGTLDVILIADEGDRAKIEDFKSHPAPFDADDHFQAKLYSYMLMKHLPKLQKVTFELNFVRYQNCFRSATFSRKDMPALQADIARARARQRATHENPEAALALPCKTCTYCPLAKTLSCPVGEWNEYTSMSPETRLMQVEWMRRMRSLHMPIIKANAEVHGPVSYVDGNGVRYEYGPQEVAKTRYPVDVAAMQILRDWKDSTGEDLLDGRLNFSSSKLKPLLKAKKRAELLEQFEESVIETSTAPKFAVRTPDEGVVQDYNPYEEE